MTVARYALIGKPSIENYKHNGMTRFDSLIFFS